LASFWSNQTSAAPHCRVDERSHATASRGPDSDGVVAHGSIALGHRRLAIIDLSAQGGQPIVDQRGNPAVFHLELTTALTTTMTKVRPPDTSTYKTVELILCLVTPSARAYGSEGWGFESLRARPGQRRFSSLWKGLCWFFDDSFDDLIAPAGLASAQESPQELISRRARAGGH
jgi:hypothetical protein